MSDLQDLIHRNAQLAYDQGAERERERIIKLLENDEWHWIAKTRHEVNGEVYELHLRTCLACRQIDLIKGEQK